MHRLTRRELVQAAAAMSATLALPSAQGARPRAWREVPEAYAEGVASGDPTSDSVLLWTRVSAPANVSAVPLTVEVSETPTFEQLVTSASTRALAAADHTCRVLVAGLEPSQVYWYRFIDERGRGSRIGRTRTAAAPDDTNPVKFAFVSCQNVCEGAQNAYRRMIFEDERAAPAEQLAFVLHLGDFIYEVIDYPEEVPGGHRYDRRIREVLRYPHGEKVGRFHIAVTLADYRALYRAYLHDPDIQAARARWPFVAMWDNHEFSWMGWQSQQRFDRQNRPAQTRKVAANQAWFEYQPARVARPGRQSLQKFEAPVVKDVPLKSFDAHGLSHEPNNIAAIDSLIAYRALRWGRHLELIITDQHSFRSEEPTSGAEAAALDNPDFPQLIPQEIMERLDAGEGGRPPQTILGQRQKQWFLETLRASKQTWKVWGNSIGTLDWRADPQNIPSGMGRQWPGAGYACFGGGGDYGTAYRERAEIYDVIRDASIANFVTVSGDRHSFWAGLAAKGLPPSRFEPVGAAFITGSISAPGLVEAFEHRFPKDHPLRPLYMADRDGKPQPTVNLLLHHGVRACLEYAKSGDLEAARRLTNPDLAPHLRFLDLGGHGYATLRLAAENAECEFVCIPRPLERSATDDGGPLRYRVVHTVRRWAAGERPVLQQRVIEGDPGLSL